MALYNISSLQESRSKHEFGTRPAVLLETGALSLMRLILPSLVPLYQAEKWAYVLHMPSLEARDRIKKNNHCGSTVPALTQFRKAVQIV
jgi:hypothetical protein